MNILHPDDEEPPTHVKDLCTIVTWAENRGDPMGNVLQDWLGSILASMMLAGGTDAVRQYLPKVVDDAAKTVEELKR